MRYGVWQLMPFDAAEPVVSIKGGATNLVQRIAGCSAVIYGILDCGIGISIKEAIEVQSVAKRSTSDVYGGGDAGNQIANLLAQLPLQFHKTIM